MKDHPRLPNKMDLARDLSGRVNLVSPCLGTSSPEEMLSIRDKAPGDLRACANSDWGYRPMGVVKRSS